MRQWILLLLFTSHVAQADLTNLGSWIFDSSGNSLNSTSNALNSFLTNSSIPVTQSGSWSINQAGTWTVQQGSPNTLTNGWPVKITDGTNTAAVKAASTAPLATDPALVVALSPNTTGQQIMTASQPVVLSSNQTGINTFQDKSGTGTISALNGAVTVTTNGMSTIAFSAQGTFSATLQVQCQAGDNAWDAVIGYLPGVGTTSTVLTGASLLVFPIGGCNQVRLIAIAYTSGTANIQYNLGVGVQGLQTFNLTPASLQAMVTGSGSAGTPNTGVVTVQGIAGGTVLPSNVSQFGGTNISTGTGASGTGIPRVTLSNDSQVKLWDGTNNTTVKAGSVEAALTDTAVVVTNRPDNVGTPTQTSVSCAATSTTLLAASTATMFLAIRNPTTSTQTIWINVTGAAAVAAAPSIDLAPGAEADFFAEGSSFLPTAQINCISGGTASTVTVMYK